MLNFDTKEKAIKRLERAVQEHELIRAKVQDASIKLFEQRQRAATEVIQQVEIFVNLLANSPKEFDKAVSEYRFEVKRFQTTVRDLKLKAAESTLIGGGIGAAGTVAGVGVAAFGSTAAMAVATTFGTASTGTAISALSGAAATNAALAWLGGGALAAGGGGMAAGQTFLALAGPVGWAIGGVALVGSGIYLNTQNSQDAEEAIKKAMEVEAEIRSLQVADREIQALFAKTKKLSDGCLNALIYFQTKVPQDYQQFSYEQKEVFGLLINNIRSLGKLLNTQVNL